MLTQIVMTEGQILPFATLNYPVTSYNSYVFTDKEIVCAVLLKLISTRKSIVLVNNHNRL